MARLPRLIVPDQAHHLIQRGHDGQLAFRAAEDYLFFLQRLRDAARQFQVAIHAYALLPDQVQLLATPSDETGLARMMQWVGRHYVPYFNRLYQRSGTLWQGRYRASVIDAEQYLLVCSRFIELAPVRAGLVPEAAAYPWTSYVHHIGAHPHCIGRLATRPSNARRPIAVWRNSRWHPSRLPGWRLPCRKAGRWDRRRSRRRWKSRAGAGCNRSSGGGLGLLHQRQRQASKAIRSRFNTFFDKFGRFQIVKVRKAN